ncbi:hypothetical protein VE00_04525, partial [Pseudogymnoascus sp. WSF 3629]
MTSEENSHIVNNGMQTTPVAEEAKTVEKASTVDDTTVDDDTTMDDGMRTPKMRSINVADAYDWKHQADVSEQGLLIVQAELE